MIKKNVIKKEVKKTAPKKQEKKSSVEGWMFSVINV
jgi:hypothetical protein